MDTRVDEIADTIYRLSTFVPDIGPTGFTSNRFLVADDQPLLAELAPTTLAVMHGSCFRGDGAAALRALADDYDARLASAKG